LVEGTTNDDDNNNNKKARNFLVCREGPKMHFQGGGRIGGCPFGVFQVPVKL
jgi:hypothetical protein